VEASVKERRRFFTAALLVNVLTLARLKARGNLGQMTFDSLEDKVRGDAPQTLDGLRVTAVWA